MPKLNIGSLNFGDGLSTTLYSKYMNNHMPKLEKTAAATSLWTAAYVGSTIFESSAPQASGGQQLLGEKKESNLPGTYPMLPSMSTTCKALQHVPPPNISRLLLVSS